MAGSGAKLRAHNGAMAGLTARVEEPVGVARVGEPLTHGVPFRPGALWQPERVGLHAAGGPLPTQGTALAHWPDGSVKWLLVDSLLDLAARQVLPVRLEHGPGSPGAPVPEVLTVTPVPDGLRVETGGVGVVLAASGTRLIAAAILAPQAAGSTPMTVLATLLALASAIGWAVLLAWHALGRGKPLKLAPLLRLLRR